MGKTPPYYAAIAAVAFCLVTGSALWAADEKSAAKDAPAITLDEAVVSGTRDTPAKEPAKEREGVVPLGRYHYDVTPADRARFSSTPELLYDVPGVSLQQNGGVAGIPFMHGLGDDRIKVLLNGMTITPACSNHMNAPLSYIDPTNVSTVNVIAGITPVSMGGDSIGGTILLESAPPVFAGPGETLHPEGSISSYFRSNSNSYGGSVSASLATANVSAGYAGSWDYASDYHDGSGTKVTSTYYKTNNQSVTLAAQGGGNLFVVQGGQQYIPGQGFVNQQMDMTKNFGEFLNGRFRREFGWGWLDARAYWHDVRHEMNLGHDKDNFPMPMFMPMETHGIDLGYSLKAEMSLTKQHVLRVGNEFHRFELNDWWPPVDGTAPWMAPDTFNSINNGRRNRIGTFGEWEARWTPAWTTLLGVRNDTVWMNTGDVHGYSAMYAADAVLFNARDRSRTDVNFDVTALVRYEPDTMSTYEAGYARKTRSPNLYERYAWSTNMMASGMINWFGDGNYYVGNVDLKPEIAHTMSATAGWHDSARKDWEVKVIPYFSYVEDYIGVDELMSVTYGASTFSQLMFANHDARIFGVDVAGGVGIWESASVGSVRLKGIIGYVHGETVNTGKSLYHMMPLNGLLRIDHALNGWGNAVELQAVGRKTAVDPLRREPQTPAYALVNLRTSYQWWKVRLDAGITNLLNKNYDLPLGGVNFDEFLASGWTGNISPVKGPGRSFYAAMTVKF